MQYKGKINISIKQKNKIVDKIELHNTGTLTLQKILCNSFIGNYDNNNIPAYLGLYTTDDTMITNSIVLTASHVVEIKEENTITGYSADFTASVISRDSGDSSIAKIGLLSKKGDLLAFRNLISTDAEKINNYLKANREVVIDWSMTINTTDTN